MKKLITNNNLIIHAPVILIGLLLFLLTGCQQEVKIGNLDDMVLKARSNVNSISVDKFKDLMDQNDNIVIIDCRQDGDFIKGHIPGAISITRGMIGFSDKLTNRRDEIYIYGYSDDCSALAAESLQALKYSKVKMIENGWEGWKAYYPDSIETGADTPGEETAPKVEESGGCGG